MTRYAFDPSEATRWHIPIPKPLPPLEVGAFDEPRTCLGINIEWMILIVVCSDILADRRTWENESANQLNYIQQQVGLIQSRLLRDTDCEAIEECPDPIVTRQYDGDCYRLMVNGEPASDWICPSPLPQPQSEAGKTGLSYQELEDYYMACVNIAAGIKIENGHLWAKDDCCVWVDVGDISQLAASTKTKPMTFGDLGDITGGIEGLSAGLPELTPIPHPTTEFNNEWTRKCLKATSLKYILQTAFEDIRDSAAEIPETGWAAFLGAMGVILSATPLGGIAIVASIASWITKWGTEFIIGAVDDIMVDDEKWDNFVCDFANIMTGAESFTGTDISNFFAKATTYTILFEEWALDLIDNFIPTEFQARVNENISAVNCECSDYLPNGYTPAVPSGCFLPVASPAGDQNTASPAAGEGAFDGNYAIGSGASWTSKLWSVIDTVNYDVLSIIIEGNIPFNISTLKANYSTAVNYTGTADPVVAWMWYYDEVEDEWLGGVVAAALPDLTLTTQTIASGTAVRAKKWAFQLRAPGGAAQGRNVISAPLLSISGTATSEEDLAFIDLPLGEQVCIE